MFETILVAIFTMFRVQEVILVDILLSYNVDYWVWSINAILRIMTHNATLQCNSTYPRLLWFIGTFFLHNNIHIFGTAELYN